MKAVERRRMATLLSKVVDGHADDADLEELELMMYDDAEARAYYLHYLAVHTDLESQGEGAAATVKMDALDGPRWSPVWMAAAACVFLALGMGFWWVNREEMASPLPAGRQASALQVENHQVLAVIGSADDARWGFPETPPRQGVRLGRGVVQLLSGRVRLDFNAGEKVTLEGPALFEIIDSQRLKLTRGNLVASVSERGRGFTVIMPSGAIVDLGTEFAASVSDEGESSVRVIKGRVMASATNRQGNTSWEELLSGGDEYVMVADAPPKRQAFPGKIPEALHSEIPVISLGDNYAKAVVSSKPLGYWRFDVPVEARRIPNEVAGSALELGGRATIKANQDAGVLLLNLAGGGYAVSTEAFADLNSARGSSLELWAISDSVEWQTLAGLVLDGPRPTLLYPSHARHNPHMLMLERAGVAGSNWNHIHPNFAMRSVHRSPAGYTGGVNAYSEADYLIHAWHHFVVVNRADGLLIYVDGELSGETQSAFNIDPENYKLLLGRLHTLGTSADARPWRGAIDEVSLYDRALSDEEVRRHYEAAHH
ncbi:LamG-like jellyroll fold domain-containing protein [Verrucomicrobiaceae bacterium 227]